MAVKRKRVIALGIVGQSSDSILRGDKGEIETIKPIIVQLPTVDGANKRVGNRELTTLEQTLLDKVQEIAYKVNTLIEDNNYKVRNEF